MNPTPLRVAAIGAGYFSRFHYDAWSRLGIELVAVCDQNQEAAAAVAECYGNPPVFTDVARMLDSVALDLVDIITPPVTHLALIEQVMARRIPVICQKAFTDNLQQAEQAVQIADTANVPLVVHENFRFQPWYRRIRELLDDGAVGEIYGASFRLRPGDGQGPRAYLDRQPYFQQMPRFLIRETGVHFIDVFRYLFGEVEAVTARLVRLNPVISGEDAGFVVFEFTNGTRALFDGNRLVDHAAANTRLTMGEMLIEGSAATLRLDGCGRLFRRAMGSQQEAALEFDWSRDGFGGDCVFALQQHVVAHFRDGAPLVNEARDYLTNLRVEDAIYRADRESRTIRLGEPPVSSG